MKILWDFFGIANEFSLDENSLAVQTIQNPKSKEKVGGTRAKKKWSEALFVPDYGENLISVYSKFLVTKWNLEKTIR